MIVTKAAFDWHTRNDSLLFDQHPAIFFVFANQAACPFSKFAASGGALTEVVTATDQMYWTWYTCLTRRRISLGGLGVFQEYLPL